MKRAISYRTLQENAGEILRAVEDDEHFTVTRDGVPVEELTPVRKHFVAREHLIEALRGAPSIDAERFRAEVDEPLDQDIEPRA